MPREVVSTERPKYPVGFVEAVSLCRQNPKWCMRPTELSGSGVDVAWRVRLVNKWDKIGKLISVGEHGPVDQVSLILGTWEVLRLDALEREQTEHETGVEL